LIFATIWHELGHMLAARLVNVSVQRISIGLGPVLWQYALTAQTNIVLRAMPIGMAVAVPGRWTQQGDLNRPLHHDLWMVLGGPCASVLLSGLLLAMARWGGFPDAWNMIWVGVGMLSLLVALFNLLPIPGLDGGHLLLLGFHALGRPVPPMLERRLHHLGIYFAAVMLPLLAIILHD
jgi:membrane-associated protease RseP (regulator of RpoE activity)